MQDRHTHLTVTVEQGILSAAKAAAGPVPLSRWIEDLIKDALADDA